MIPSSPGHRSCSAWVSSWPAYRIGNQAIVQRTRHQQPGGRPCVVHLRAAASIPILLVLPARMAGLTTGRTRDGPDWKSGRVLPSVQLLPCGVLGSCWERWPA
jgi:hypothetical protein